MWGSKPPLIPFLNWLVAAGMATANLLKACCCWHGRCLAPHLLQACCKPGLPPVFGVIWVFWGLLESFGVIPGSLRGHSGIISGSFQGLLCEFSVGSAPARRRHNAGTKNSQRRLAAPDISLADSIIPFPHEEPCSETLS